MCCKHLTSVLWEESHALFSQQMSNVVSRVSAEELTLDGFHLLSLKAPF
jgi:hypothetical protein